MRAPTSFNTSFLLSTWVSAACHGAVILVGFWLHTDPASRTPPEPALDHGENAVTIVWRSPAPPEPSAIPEIPPPDEDIPIDELDEELVTKEEQDDEKEEKEAPSEKLEPQIEPEPWFETAPEPPALPEPPGVEPAPLPLRSSLTPKRPVTKRPADSPSTEARAVTANAPRSTPAMPLPALLENATVEPPGKPGVRDAPRLASRLAPRYPRSCRRRGHQGTVRLECRLSSTGNVVSARIVSSTGCDRLDQAALDAIQRARFEPARVGGEPAAGTILLPVEFRLR